MRFPHPNKTWYAIATLAGSIIGIGIFGIPFVFAKAGFGLGLIFLALVSTAVIYGYLLYGEVVLRTHERHQFFGYVRKYLGPIWKWIALFKFWIGVFGVTVAALIINGNFLSQIFSFIGLNISPITAATGMLVIMSIIVYSGLRTVSRIDFVMMFVFFILVIMIAAFGFQHIETTNYTLATGNFILLPFGVILFAMMGVQGIPLSREVLKGREKSFKKVIIVGTLIPVILYLIFATAVVGISGELTTPQAISGLSYFLGDKVVLIGLLFGFFASTTIFLSVLTSFQKTLWEDFKIHKRLAFILLIIPPYILYRANVTNFINIIELVGGIVGSLSMIILILMHTRANPKMPT